VQPVDTEMIFLLEPGRDEALKSHNYYAQQKRIFLEQYRRAFLLDSYQTAKLCAIRIRNRFVLADRSNEEND